MYCEDSLQSWTKNCFVIIKFDLPTFDISPFFGAFIVHSITFYVSIMCISSHLSPQYLDFIFPIWEYGYHEKRYICEIT